MSSPTTAELYHPFDITPLKCEKRNALSHPKANTYAFATVSAHGGGRAGGRQCARGSQWRGRCVPTQFSANAQVQSASSPLGASSRAPSRDARPRGAASALRAPEDNICVCVEVFIATRKHELRGPPGRGSTNVCPDVGQTWAGSTTCFLVRANLGRQIWTWFGHRIRPGVGRSRAGFEQRPPSTRVGPGGDPCASASFDHLAARLDQIRVRYDSLVARCRPLPWPESTTCLPATHFGPGSIIFCMGSGNFGPSFGQQLARVPTTLNPGSAARIAQSRFRHRSARFGPNSRWIRLNFCPARPEWAKRRPMIGRAWSNYCPARPNFGRFQPNLDRFDRPTCGPVSVSFGRVRANLGPVRSTDGQLDQLWLGFGRIRAGSDQMPARSDQVRASHLRANCGPCSAKPGLGLTNDWSCFANSSLGSAKFETGRQHFSPGPFATVRLPQTSLFFVFPQHSMMISPQNKQRMIRGGARIPGLLRVEQCQTLPPCARLHVWKKKAPPCKPHFLASFGQTVFSDLPESRRERLGRPVPASCYPWRARNWAALGQVCMDGRARLRHSRPFRLLVGQHRDAAQSQRRRDPSQITSARRCVAARLGEESRCSPRVRRVSPARDRQHALSL